MSCVKCSWFGFLVLVYACAFGVAECALGNSEADLIRILHGVQSFGISETGWGALLELQDPRTRGYLAEKMLEGDRTRSSVSGRAQMLLAGMGDREAIAEIKEEARQDRSAFVREWAFRKIREINPRIRMAILGQILEIESPAADPSRPWQFRETPEERAATEMWRNLVESGVSREVIPGWRAEHVEAWRKWWKENEQEYTANLYLVRLPVSDELHWARILRHVESSARDSARILDIGRSGESSLLGYLRDRRRLLAQGPDDLGRHLLKSGPMRHQRSEIDKYLEMAIAKLGGGVEFEAIAAELISKDRSVWLGAIEKLGYVGGESALEILEEFVGKVSRNEPSRTRGVGEALVAARRTIEKLREEEIDTSTSTPQPEPTGDLSWVQDEKLRFTFCEAES